ncbi:hypothetical protein Bpfe_026428, partial [Biomphalaria pfeifferi]
KVQVGPFISEHEGTIKADTTECYCIDATVFSSLSFAGIEYCGILIQGFSLC